MDCANYPNWFGVIRPFHDFPKVTMAVLFYTVDKDNPSAPAGIWPTRFFDYKDGWRPPDAGTIPGSLVPYFGEVPDPREFGRPEGDADEWARGLDFNEFARGKVSKLPCWPFDWRDGAVSGGMAAETWTISTAWTDEGCSCAVPDDDEEIIITWTDEGCGCGTADETWIPSFVFDDEACTCAAADEVWIPSAAFDDEACSCGTGDSDSPLSISWTDDGCGCGTATDDNELSLATTEESCSCGVGESDIALSMIFDDDVCSCGVPLEGV